MALDAGFLGFVLHVVSMIVVAGAVYGGIRADLRHLGRMVDHAIKSADEAHRRIDDYLVRRRGHDVD